MTTSNTAQLQTNSQVQSLSTGWMQNLAALAFGAAVMFAVGFLPMDEAHNAAHDTRHALAFPCH